MKHTINYLLIIILSSILISCSDEVGFPDANISVDNLTPKVGETVKFTISGDAETFVIFTGDQNHEFVKSHLALTTGVDVDQESVVLLASSLTDVRNYLTPRVNNYNSTVGPGAQYDMDVLMTNIATLVDKQYTNKLTAAYEMWLFMPGLNGQVLRDVVNSYFQDNSVSLAPTGGFSKGTSVNRYVKTLDYAYTTPGMYVVTLVATNLSDKQYSGSGYQDDRTSTADEYKYKRTIKEIVITVQP